MRTKYILHIGSTDYELQDDDLENWADINCSYKRASYDGVVRSFTSKFQFVNRAYDILMALYLRDRFNAQASFEVLTMNDRWEYDSRFECPLDFSTVEWEKGILSINAVDNSLAALIKANKSTKYEFAVGSDINPDETFNFDRLPMMENLTYGFTQGTTYDDCADISVSFRKGEHPWVGNKGSEMSVNLTVEWNDDQETDIDSYILKVKKDVRMKFSYNVGYRSNMTYGSGVFFRLRVKRGATVLPIGGNGEHAGCDCGYAAPSSKHNFGDYTSPSQLPDITKPHWSDYTQTTDWRYSGYATINGIVWECSYRGWTFVWRNTDKSVNDYFAVEYSGNAVFDLKAGDIVFMEHDISTNLDVVTVRFIKTEFVLGWMAVGDAVDIPVLTPRNVCMSLLRRIAGEQINVSVDISGHDKRLAGTYLLAAESARGIIGAKFYSSFSEFCDWMATVFGYIYYIGPVRPSRFLPVIRECGDYEWSPWAYLDEMYTGAVDTDKIVYMEQHGRFFYHDTDSGNVYAKWIGWTDYNNPDHGHARSDTLFRIKEKSETDLYYFEEYEIGKTLTPILYEHTEDDVSKDGQVLYFVHRSEVLNPNAEVRSLRNCRGLKYSVDTSSIYSTVTVGYDKKDYESINGRDEFNFSNTYMTGCSVSDKSLSLLSKYRADSYGIEFAVQKRGEDTTDTTSDKDVFFVLCSKDAGGRLGPDRSVPIANTLSDQVFNGAFSPMACIRANAGYIGLQADKLDLKFASSTGNSDIEIDGAPMTSDLTLDTPLATAATVEFTTDEVEMSGDVNGLVEIVCDGVLYRGFIKEADLKYAREEAAKYKLIVKDIVP